jgi:hypothetical protein
MSTLVWLQIALSRFLSLPIIVTAIALVTEFALEIELKQSHQALARSRQPASELAERTFGIATILQFGLHQFERVNIGKSFALLLHGSQRKETPAAKAMSALRRAGYKGYSQKPRGKQRHASSDNGVCRLFGG